MHPTPPPPLSSSSELPRKDTILTVTVSWGGYVGLENPGEYGELYSAPREPMLL